MCARVRPDRLVLGGGGEGVLVLGRAGSGGRGSNVGIEKLRAQGDKDDKLREWFVNLSGEVSRIDSGDTTQAGRVMQQMLSAMEDVEQFHQIQGNAHVRHLLEVARGSLRQMLRLINVREQVLNPQP